MTAKLFSAVLAAVAVVGAAALVMAPAGAAQLFTVSDVEVDSTAASAQVAREKALAEGQRRALRLLLEKLTLKSDHGRLPVISKSLVTDLVQGYEVADERRSAKRYLARLTVRFKPDAVRDLLRRARIPFAESTSAPVVVLPIYEIGEEARLWADPNPWRAAWRDLDRQRGLVELVIPFGELADIAAIDAEQALAGDRDRLRRIAEQYDSVDALVASARVSEDATGAPVVDVTVRRFGATGVATMVDRFPSPAGATQEEALAAAAAAVAARIERDWKMENLLSYDNQNEINFAVTLDSLENFVALRGRLEKLSRIQRVSVIQMTRRNAWLNVRYLGNQNQLIRALALRKMALTAENGRWVLRETRRFRAETAIDVQSLPELDDVDSSPPDEIEPAAVDDMLVE